MTAPDTSRVTAETPDLEGQLLRELAGHQLAPAPEDLRMSPARLERWMLSVILPFFGLHAFLLGGLFLAKTGDAMRSVVGVTYPLVGACTLLFRWRGALSFRASAYVMGGAATALLLGAMTIPTSTLRLAVALPTALVLPAIVLGRVAHPKSGAVLAWYLPLLTHWYTPGVTTWVALVGYASTFALLVRTRALAFALGAVALWTGLAVVVARDTPRAPDAIALAAGACVAAAVYERKVDRGVRSALRMTLDESWVVVAVAVLVYHACYGTGVVLGTKAWIWAGACVAYEATSLRRDPTGGPLSRVTWMVVPFIVSVWLSDQWIPWPARVALSLVAAGGLRAVGIARRSRVLDEVSILVGLVVVAALAVALPRRSADLTTLVLGAASSAFLLLASGDPVEAPRAPWWQGLVGRRYRVLVLGYSSNLVKWVAKAPFLSFFAGGAALALSWVRYLANRLFPPRSHSFVYTAGHVYSAFVLGDQVSRMAVQSFPTWDAAYVVPVFQAAAWSVWGLGLSVAGIRRGAAYARVLGALLCTWLPLRSMFASNSMERRTLATIFVLSGGAVTVVGLLVKGRVRRVLIPAAASSPETHHHANGDG